MSNKEPIFDLPPSREFVSDKDLSDRQQIISELQFNVRSWRARGLSETAIAQVMEVDCRFIYKPEDINTDLDFCSPLPRLTQ